MQTIITRALTELDIKPVPSRRCFTIMCELVGWGLWLLGAACTRTRRCPATSHGVLHSLGHHSRWSE